MLHDFTVCGPERIVSGAGALAQLPEVLDNLGAKRALVMTGRTLATKTDLVSRVEDTLKGRHVGTFAECGQHVPASSVVAASKQTAHTEADVLVVFGGGSPIDTAKMVAFRQIEAGSAPIVQVNIPTTLSAGEFTHAAGMTDENTRVKHVYAHPGIQPRVVIYDPELTRPTPVSLWLATGVKALDHAVEGVWWPNCHPFLETLRLGAIADLRKHLAASRHPQNLDSRLACMHAGWKSISGLLSAKNVGFRLSHPLGHQIGARWDIPHGVTSCIVLPAVCRFLQPRTQPAQAKIAAALGADGGTAEDAINDFLDTLSVPRRLSECGAERADIPLVAEAVAEELAQLGAPDRDAATPQALSELLESVW